MSHLLPFDPPDDRDPVTIPNMDMLVHPAVRAEQERATRLRDLTAIEDDIKADTSRDGRDLLRVIAVLKEMNR